MIRFIGDVHGKYGEYIPLAKQADYSLCVGDIGLNYNSLQKHLDSTKHKCIGGNHDNYSLNENGEFFVQTPHFLGDFGVYTIPNFTDIFFVRGAWSIDRKWQEARGTWFPDEQLSYDKRQQALELYKTVKPNYVVTHSCPFSVVSLVGNPNIAREFGHKKNSIITDTNLLLEEMLDFHQPKLWIFGHFHVNRTVIHRNTIFTCIDELSVLDFQDYNDLQSWLKRKNPQSEVT